MLRQFSTKRIVGFFILDWISSLGMLLLAATLRAEIGRLPTSIINLMNFLNIQSYGFWGQVTPGELLPWQVFLVVGLIWPFFFGIFSVYDARRNETLYSELLNVFLAISVSVLTLAGILYFSYRETPRVLIIIFYILDVILLLGFRIIWRVFVLGYNPARVNQHRLVIIVGAGLVGQQAAQQLNKFAWANIEIVGYLDDDPNKKGNGINGLPILGTLKEAKNVVSENGINDAIIALPLQAHKKLIEICQMLQEMSVHVHVIPDLFALSFPSSTLDGFGGIPVIDLGQPGIHGLKRAIKRAFDIVAVSTGLILISPILLIIALLIKLESRGPIIFRQPRIGENGQIFTMYKFRSMYEDADPSLHKEQATRLIKYKYKPSQLYGNLTSSSDVEYDPRITKIGRIIRKTCLDELPQLWNVLKGEMSLVGPRPPLTYEVDLYQGWHKRRLEVPPGITGLWQVKGRSKVSFDEMVRMDLEYIDHQSLWFDIKLLLLTPKAIITAMGAQYGVIKIR